MHLLCEPIIEFALPEQVDVHLIKAECERTSIMLVGVKQLVFARHKAYATIVQLTATCLTRSSLIDIVAMAEKRFPETLDLSPLGLNLPLVWYEKVLLLFLH